MLVLDCGRKPERPEKTPTHTNTTQGGPSWESTYSPLAVSRSSANLQLFNITGCLAEIFKSLSLFSQFSHATAKKLNVFYSDLMRQIKKKKSSAITKVRGFRSYFASKPLNILWKCIHPFTRMPLNKIKDQIPHSKVT